MIIGDLIGFLVRENSIEKTAVFQCVVKCFRVFFDDRMWIGIAA